MLEVVKYFKHHLTDHTCIFLDCGNKMKKQTLHEFFRRVEPRVRSLQRAIATCVHFNDRSETEKSRNNRCHR